MEYGAMSHVGLCRDCNQDSFCLVENNGDILAVVCDGIAGGNGGEVASRLATTYLENAFKTTKFEKMDDIAIKKWIMQVMQEVNDYIFMHAMSSSKLYGMGTTLVAILYVNKSAYVFHAGDSRCYALYPNDFIALTEDHSYLAKLIKEKKISMEEAKRNPNRHVLVNAVGIWNEFKVDIHKVVDGYQYLLLCSDGLHGYVSENQIKDILSDESNVDMKLKQLIAASLHAGGYDNVTVLIIDKDGVKHE